MHPIVWHHLIMTLSIQVEMFMNDAVNYGVSRVETVEDMERNNNY